MFEKPMSSWIFSLVEENSEIYPVLTPSRTQSITNVFESHAKCFIFEEIWWKQYLIQSVKQREKICFDPIVSKYKYFGYQLTK
jgi:hypothetical protein